MIRVGFSHSVGFWSILSRIIMKVTSKPYSHCWFLLDGDDGIRGVPVVLEENKDGLHFVPWSKYDHGKKIVKILTPTIPLDPGVDSMIHKLGEEYDFAGLIGQGWVVFMKRWMKRKVKNPLRSANRMWCSEAIVLAMRKSPGYNRALLVDPEVSTPGDVEDLILNP